MAESLMYQDLDDDEPVDESRPLKNFKRIDGTWSWFVCVLFFTCSLIEFGSAASYGILFPNILKEFNTTRAIAGK